MICILFLLLLLFFCIVLPNSLNVKFVFVYIYVDHTDVIQMCLYLLKKTHIKNSKQIQKQQDIV